MDTKKYKVVSTFKDKYTDEIYTKEHEPLELSKERVEEIRKVEKLKKCKLIEEIKEK